MSNQLDANMQNFRNIEKRRRNKEPLAHLRNLKSLNDADIAKVKSMIEQGLSQSVIASRMCVSLSIISQIKTDSYTRKKNA